MTTDLRVGVGTRRNRRPKRIFAAIEAIMISAADITNTRNTMNISPYGELRSCTRSSQNALGPIFNISPKKVMTKSAFNNTDMTSITT